MGNIITNHLALNGQAAACRNFQDETERLRCLKRQGVFVGLEPALVPFVREHDGPDTVYFETVGEVFQGQAAILTQKEARPLPKVSCPEEAAAFGGARVVLDPDAGPTFVEPQIVGIENIWDGQTFIAQVILRDGRLLPWAVVPKGSDMDWNGADVYIAVGPSWGWGDRSPLAYWGRIIPGGETARLRALTGLLHLIPDVARQVPMRPGDKGAWIPDGDLALAGLFDTLRMEAGIPSEAPAYLTLAEAARALGALVDTAGAPLPHQEITQALAKLQQALGVDIK